MVAALRHPAARLPLTCAAGGLLFLGTSSNRGTAFALPLVVVATLAALTVFQRRAVIFAAVASTATAVALLGVASPVVAGRALWLHQLPVEAEVDGSLGCDCAAVVPDDLLKTVVSRVGPGRLLVLRDDAVINMSGLVYTARVTRGLSLATVAYGATELRSTDLDGADAVLSGRTLGPYHATLDLDGADALLVARGFRKDWSLALSPDNRLDLWRRTA
jgi:hypothetical protein